MAGMGNAEYKVTNAKCKIPCKASTDRPSAVAISMAPCVKDLHRQYPEHGVWDFHKAEFP